MLPPGAAAPQPTPSAPNPTPAPPEPTLSTPSKADPLLPPGAAPASTSQPKKSAADELLPPGASEKSDELLPPGAGQGPTSKQIAVRAKSKELVEQPGRIHMPTEDGDVVTIREPVKTVTVGDEEMELNELTPDEKERRRFIRTIFVWGFCVVVLGASLLLLWLILGK